MKQRYSKLLMILLLCITYQLGFAKIIKETYKNRKTYEVKKWDVLDITFKTNSKADNPFTTDFSAVFTHESGKERLVHGFYNGGKEWVIRFSASELGKWTFQTSGIKGITNKKGSVNILPNKDKTKHGSVVINKDTPQHFHYEDGTPYFLLAFECDWLFALDYENEEGLPKTDHFLKLLEENKINQIVMNVYSHDVRWKKDEKLSAHPEHEYGGRMDIFPFLGDNKNPDFSALNPTFFQKLDRTIEALDNYNITSHLMIYVWNKLVNWPDMYSDADNMYFDYVVKRYQAFPHIVWDISKEALYYGRADDKYILERLERLRKLNTFDRLVSVHDYAFCSRHPESVDFISMQNWQHRIYTITDDAKKKYKGKPIFNIEHGGYEVSPYTVFTGDYIDPEVCLRRNYLILFAGGYSTYYWQAAAWNVIIHNPYEQPSDFVKPQFAYYKHLVDFFTKYPYVDFKPTPNRNTSGYAMQNENEDALIFVPKENYKTSAWYLKEKEGKTLTIQWFNTLTGEYTEAKEKKKNQPLISPWQGKADSILIGKYHPKAN